MTRSRPDPTPSRSDAPTAGAFVFVLVVVGLQAACLGAARDELWGLHVAAFLPVGVAAAGWILLVAGGGAVATGRLAVLERAVAPRAVGRWTWVVVPLVAGVLFWLLRSRQDLLGDAFPLIHGLPEGETTHPRQPLTMWLQQQLHTGLGPLFAGAGDAVATARRTVALGSVFCGVVFTFVARGLGRELVALLPDERRTVAPDAVALLIALQGWSLLFFGYLENYTFVALVLAAWLWTTLRALRTGGSLVGGGLLFVLAVGLHLSTAALAPLLVLAVFLHGRTHRRRIDAVATIAVTVVAAIALQVALRAVDPGFSLIERVAGVLEIARQDQGGGAGLSYLLSARHWNDWFNAQMLLGPVGVFALIIGAVALAVRAGSVRRRSAFARPGVVLVLAAAGLVAAAHWSTVEPALGYARDWDLFAPTSVFVTVAAVFVLLSLGSPRVQRRILVLALGLSLWHTGTWVALNASEARSRERFAHLPLGLGRTEVVLARRHLQDGDEAGARRWLRRSLERNPSNNNAWAMLSSLDAASGDVDRAIAALENARDALPRKPEYHRRLVDLLAREGRTEAQARALERWLEVDPDAPDRWLDLARVRLALGRDDAAREALAHAAGGYRRAFERRADADLAVRIGDCEAGLQRMGEAVAWYRRALEVDPDAPVAHARLAVITRAQGDAAAAARHREAALAGGLDAAERTRLDAAFGSGGE